MTGARLGQLRHGTDRRTDGSRYHLMPPAPKESQVGWLVSPGYSHLYRVQLIVGRVVRHGESVPVDGRRGLPVQVITDCVHHRVS